MHIIKEKYLIVNADDFGIDEEINKGIIECCEYGIVSSVSILPNGCAFEDALDFVKKNSNVSAGVHLCLIEEKPILPKDKIPSLVNEKGFFPKKYPHLFFKLYSRKINLSEIKNELDAQIKKLLNNGIIPTHLDSHQYIHLIPSIFNIVIELAKKYKIRYIRYPKRSIYMHCSSMSGFIKKAYLTLSSGQQLSMLAKNNINCANLSFGFAESGRLNEMTIKRVLKCAQNGLNDLTCHPGYSPRNNIYNAWHYQWQKETRIFTREGIKNLIKESNITLTNYAI